MSSGLPKKGDNVNDIAQPLADEVFEAVHTVMHLYRSRQHRALRDTPYELTHLESKVLAFFARHPGAALSELVARSGRDKAQLARLVRSLREKDLLEAGEHESDRRSARLQPTAAGQKVYKALHASSTDVAALAVHGLSEAECRKLTTLLAKLRANLDDGDAKE